MRSPLRVVLGVLAVAGMVLPVGVTAPVEAVGAPLVHPAATPVITGKVCPTTAPPGTLRDGSAAIGIAALCAQAVAHAPTLQAKGGLRAAFHMLGAPYACGGVGRQDPFRFDCSSLVSRAYYLGAGLDTAGPDWAPSTRDMVPWDNTPLASWAAYLAPSRLQPGDLVLYDTGGATYRHVVMYIGNGYMLHTNSCGDVAHVSQFWGFATTQYHRFLVVRRVVAPGQTVPPDPTKPTPTPTPTPKPPPSGVPAGVRVVSLAALLRHDPATVKVVQASLNALLGPRLSVDGQWGAKSQAVFSVVRRDILGLADAGPRDPPVINDLRALGRISGFWVTL